MLLNKQMSKKRSISDEDRRRARALKRIWDLRKSEWAQSGHKLTQALAADKFGWSEQSAVSQYLLGKVSLNLPAALKFSRLLDFPVEYLNPEWKYFAGATDHPAERHTVPVRYYPDIYASAGHGCLPISEATVTVMEIAQALLHKKGVCPDDAALIQADGDSMHGTIDHGDIMLVDLVDTNPRDGRVYVISIGEDTLVKRIQRIPRGIKLIADNPAYDAIEVLEEDQQTPITVIGRVVVAWHSRELIE